MNILNDFFEKIQLMKTEDRMELLTLILKIESDELFETAQLFADLYRQDKEEEDVGVKESKRGLLAVSLQKNSTGLGFEFRWLLLERFYRKKSGVRPQIKVINKGKRNQYNLKSVNYPGITQWEIDMFHSMENIIGPMRFKSKAIGRISRATKEYLNAVNKNKVVL
jgi:hypothetical protein